MAFDCFAVCDVGVLYTNKHCDYIFIELPGPELPEKAEAQILYHMPHRRTVFPQNLYSHSLDI